MMTMTLGHRIALLVVTSLVALMMVVVGPGVSAASADNANVSAKHSGSQEGNRGGGKSDHDKKHKSYHNKKDKNKKDGGHDQDCPGGPDPGPGGGPGRP